MVCRRSADDGCQLARNAVVSAVNERHQLVQAEHNFAGEFHLYLDPPGRYTLEVEAAGKLVKRQVVAAAGRVTRVEFIVRLSKYADVTRLHVLMLVISSRCVGRT